MTKALEYLILRKIVSVVLGTPPLKTRCAPNDCNLNNLIEDIISKERHQGRLNCGGIREWRKKSFLVCHYRGERMGRKIQKLALNYPHKAKFLLCLVIIY